MQLPSRLNANTNQILTILLTTSFILFILGKTALGHFYFKATGWVLTPVEGVVYKIGNRVGADVDFWTSLRGLSQKDRALRLQYAQVVSENARYQSLARENEALKAQLATFGTGSSKQIEASIVTIARDMKISAGGDAGVKAGDAVVLGNWLIGQVVNVEASSALVRLTTSPDLRLSVVSENGARGVVTGQFNASIMLDRVLPSEKIKEGDLILTSGENQNIPRGLVVGKIIALNRNDAAIFQSAQVAPLANFTDLENVFVVEGLGQ